MPFPHAVIWVDHHRARVIDFSQRAHHVTEVIATDAPRQLHLKRGVIGSGKPPADHRFFDEVADTLEGIDEILLTGPGTAKHELEQFLGRRRPDVARHVLATETVDHPSDGQLLAHAREAFARIDQLR